MEDELFDSAYAPCGTFSAKIDLAYRVSLLDADSRASLHLIRKMRNEAAHVSERRSLLSSQLQNRLRELSRLQAPLMDPIYKTSSIAINGKQFKMPSSPDELDALIGDGSWRLIWTLLISLNAAMLGAARSGVLNFRSESESSPSGTA